MPSSGYPSVDLGIGPNGDEANAQVIITAAVRALGHGLFIEWLEAFMGCWARTHDAEEAAVAGLIEWDM